MIASSSPSSAHSRRGCEVAGEYLPGMTTSLDTPSRGRLYAALAAGIAFLILAGVGIYGLVTGPKTPPSPAPPATSSPSTSPGPGTQSPRVTGPPRVVGSTDPDQFARNVATALFAWDTASGLMPLDYSAAILAVGDPSGTEQAGLASDVANYLPSREQWVELRKHSTSQSLTITDSYVPEAWADAIIQAPPGQVPTGAESPTKATTGAAVQLSASSVTTRTSGFGTSPMHSTVTAAGLLAVGLMVSSTVIVCVTLMVLPHSSVTL